MAQNQQQQQQQRRNKSNSGQGQDPRIYVQGTRSKLRVRISYYRNFTGQDADFPLCFGPESDPCSFSLPDSNNNNNALTVQVRKGTGFVEGIDLSGYKNFKKVGVILQGGKEVFVDIPEDPEPQPGAPAPAKPKVKRMQCAVPEGPLTSPINVYILPTIRTFDKSGKAGSEELIFIFSGPVTLIDRTTGNTLVHNGVTAKNVERFCFKTAANGLLLLEVRFAGLDRTMLVLHPDSGEECSMAMKFEI